jgi:hypothetical protein
MNHRCTQINTARPPAATQTSDYPNRATVLLANHVLGPSSVVRC